MSIELMAKVWKSDYAKTGPDGGVSHIKLLIMLKLADYANDDGELWPSQSKIATACSVSRQRVNNVVSQLKEDDKLEIITSTPGSPNRMRLLFNDLDRAVTSGDSPPNRVSPEDTGAVTSGDSGCHTTGQGAVTSGDRGSQPSLYPSDKRQLTPTPCAPSGVKAPLPTPWFLPPEAMDWALKNFPNLDIKYETEQFCSKMRSEGKKSMNWLEEWKAYIRRSDMNYRTWGKKNNKSKPLWKMEPDDIYDAYGYDPSTWPSEVRARMEEYFESIGAR